MSVELRGVWLLREGSSQQNSESDSTIVSVLYSRLVRWFLRSSLFAVVFLRWRRELNKYVGKSIVQYQLMLFLPNLSLSVLAKELMSLLLFLPRVYTFWSCRLNLLLFCGLLCGLRGHLFFLHAKIYQLQQGFYYIGIPAVIEPGLSTPSSQNLMELYHPLHIFSCECNSYRPCVTSCELFLLELFQYCSSLFQPNYVSSLCRYVLIIKETRCNSRSSFIS